VGEAVIRGNSINVDGLKNSCRGGQTSKRKVAASSHQKKKLRNEDLRKTEKSGGEKETRTRSAEQLPKGNKGFRQNVMKLASKLMHQPSSKSKWAS